MKKKLLYFSVVTLMLFYYSVGVQARYLKIDNDGDIERVSNNIFCFLIQEEKNLTLLQKGDVFDTDKCIAIITGPSELMADFREHPASFLKELGELIKYTINNEDTIKNKIDPNSSTFFKGLWLLQNIFSKDTINKLRSK